MPRNSRNPYDRAPQIRRPIGPNDRARLVFPFPGGAGSGFPFPPPWPDGSQRPNSGAGSGFPFPPPGAQRSQNPSGFSQNPSSSQSGSETSDPGDPSENQAGLPPSSLHSWDVFSLPCQRTLFRRMHDLRNEMASRPGGGSLAGRLHGRLQGSPLGIIAEQLGVPLWERLGRGAILAGSSPRARAMMRNPRLAMCLAKWGERRGLGRLNVREYMVSGHYRAVIKQTHKTWQQQHHAQYCPPRTEADIQFLLDDYKDMLECHARGPAPPERTEELLNAYGEHLTKWAEEEPEGAREEWERAEPQRREERRREMEAHGWHPGMNRMQTMQVINRMRRARGGGGRGGGRGRGRGRGSQA